MFIAHVTFAVAPENANFAMATLLHEATLVRDMDGCIVYEPFASGGEAGHVGVIHEWESAIDFDAYIKSDAFASIGQKLRPMMLAPPVSKRFDATPVITVQ